MNPAILAAAAAASVTVPASPARPIDLEVAQSGNQLTLRIVGFSPTPTSARYRLQVEAGRGANRTTQGGVVRLAPGERVTALNLTVGGAPGAPWSAVLAVEPAEGDGYRIERNSR